MSESSRRALVVPIKLEPHNNADSLSIIRIEGFQVVVNTEAWKDKDTGVYLEPETEVSVNRPEFSFLKREDKNRDKEVVRAKRLRGEWSLGLLVPTPEGFNIGDDCWDYFGLSHYEGEESIRFEAGECVPAPKYWTNLSKYDLENWKKYKSLFKDGELVTIDEKINGQNMSCVYSDGEYHVKSRNLWKKDEGSDFWRALHANESLKKYLRQNENFLVQGELTGTVKGFTYGLPKGEVKFLAFDIRKPDYHYVDSIDFHHICLENGIQTPRIFEHQAEYSEELALRHVEGEQWGNPNGIREGVIVKPVVERFERRVNGRLILKIVSNKYLSKQGDK